MSLIELTTVPSPPLESIEPEDAGWALLNAFLIFTMQTGFALLEAGCVSSKNVANIMLKNTIDVVVGGFAYWLFGFMISFGEPMRASFVGTSDYVFGHSMDISQDFFGSKCTKYIFQLSFACTATTIVSGAVAERMNFHAYIAYAFFSPLTHVFPAGWAWATGGWLTKRGFHDFAGTAVVHMCGGASALVAALMLGPRLNRFKTPEAYTMSSPVTAMTGMLILWWAWLSFNCGSTFAIQGESWKTAAFVAVNTMNGSIGGGIAGLFLSRVLRHGKVGVDIMINAVLGGLVAITGACAVISTWEAVIVGFIGGLVAVSASYLLVKLKIDDPVGAIPVHFCGGIWGIIAVGLFGRKSLTGSMDYDGAFWGGGGYLLGIQIAGCLSIIAWAQTLTFLFLLPLMLLKKLRMTEEDEILGADWVEHGIRNVGLTHRLQAALQGIDEHKLAKVIHRIAEEIDSAPLEYSSPRNRIFSVDTGGLEASKPTSTTNLRQLNGSAQAQSYYSPTPYTTKKDIYEASPDKYSVVEPTLRANSDRYKPKVYPSETIVQEFSITSDGNLVVPRHRENEKQ